MTDLPPLDPPVNPDDDEFEHLVRRVRTGLRWGRLAIAALAIGLLYVVVVNFQQGTTIVKQGDTITKLQQSPCQKNAAGKECASIRAEVARKEPIANPCISAERVFGFEPPNCLNENTGVSIPDVAGDAASAEQQLEQVQDQAADSPAAAAPQTPSHHDTTDPMPGPSGDDPPPSGGTTTTSTTTTPSATESRGTVGQVLEEATHAVDQVGETAHETTCNLAPALC